MLTKKTVLFLTWITKISADFRVISSKGGLGVDAYNYTQEKSDDKWVKVGTYHHQYIRDTNAIDQRVFLTPYANERSIALTDGHTTFAMDYEAKEGDVSENYGALMNEDQIFPSCQAEDGSYPITFFCDKHVIDKGEELTWPYSLTSDPNADKTKRSIAYAYLPTNKQIDRIEQFLSSPSKRKQLRKLYPKAYPENIYFLAEMTAEADKQIKYEKLFLNTIAQTIVAHSWVRLYLDTITTNSSSAKANLITLLEQRSGFTSCYKHDKKAIAIIKTLPNHREMIRNRNWKWLYSNTILSNHDDLPAKQSNAQLSLQFNYLSGRLSSFLWSGPSSMGAINAALQAYVFLPYAKMILNDALGSLTGRFDGDILSAKLLILVRKIAMRIKKEYSKLPTALQNVYPYLEDLEIIATELKKTAIDLHKTTTPSIMSNRIAQDMDRLTRKNQATRPIFLGLDMRVRNDDESSSVIIPQNNPTL